MTNKVNVKNVTIELPVIQPGLEIGQINIDTGEIHVTNWIHFTCESRTDCCRNMEIPASTYDIERIMDNGYELDQIVRDLSPVILNSDIPGQEQKAYILKTKPYDGTCTFLENDLCSIHEFKPFACKIYPFALEFISDERLKLVIHRDQLCHAIQPVSKDESNSKEILFNIYQLLQEELQERGYDL